MKKVQSQKVGKTSPEKKKNSFLEFIGGDFLLHPEVVKWYPYVVFLFALSAYIVFNEKSITRKTDKLKSLDKEYKSTISELQIHNEFIPYDSIQKMTKILNQQGFEKNDKTLYRVPVKVNIEE